MFNDNDENAGFAIHRANTLPSGMIDLLDTMRFVRPSPHAIDTAEVIAPKSQDSSSYSTHDLMPVTLPDGELVYCFDYSRIPFPVSRIKPELSVTGLLGVGGMGTVKLAEACGMQFAYKRFAVRTVDVTAEDERASLEKAIFESEVRAQKMCSGIVSAPNICEAGRDSDGFYIVMDYLNGKNLQEIIAGEFDVLTIEDRLLMAMGIAHNLDSLHRHKIIHRDVKSSNFQVTENDVHLIDFGMAKVVGETMPYEEDGRCYGTLSYMAPEAILQVKSDERTDQFSMGVVLYELFTGKNPIYKGDESGINSVAELNRKYDNIEDMIPSVKVSFSEFEVYCEVSEVVMKCLSKDPAKRYNSCGEVLHKLRNIYDKHINSE